MIHVERTLPASIVDDQGLREETERAIAHFEGQPPPPGKKPFRDFHAYKSKSILDELMNMFVYKCAYCEFPIVGHPTEIEHYRPKGAFLLENGEPSPLGYYWLGATWTNLLPSCIDCNRERYQWRHVSDPFFEQTPRLTGKKNRFPLADPAKRWLDRNAPNEEEPMVLDPCRDHPEEHIDFTDDGIPLPQLAAAGPSTRGKTTIDVCGLWRDALVRQRKEVLKDLEAELLETIRIIRFLHITQSDALRADYQQNLVRALDRLEVFEQPGRRFVAMTTRVINDFEALRPKAEEYLDLRAQFDVDPASAAVEAQLEAVIADLRRFIDRDGARARLRRRMVEDFIGMLV